MPHAGDTKVPPLSMPLSKESLTVVISIRTNSPRARNLQVWAWVKRIPQDRMSGVGKSSLFGASLFKAFVNNNQKNLCLGAQEGPCFP
jgi:hypothetical protein